VYYCSVNKNTESTSQLLIQKHALCTQCTKHLITKKHLKNNFVLSLFAGKHTYCNYLTTIKQSQLFIPLHTTLFTFIEASLNPIFTFGETLKVFWPNTLPNFLPFLAIVAHFLPFLAIFGPFRPFAAHFRSFSAIFGPPKRSKMVHNWRQMVITCPNWPTMNKRWLQWPKMIENVPKLVETGRK